MTPRALCSALPVAVLALAGTAFAQNTLTKETPFQSANAPTTEAQSETIEFAGIITNKVGKKTDLIFYDKVAKKTRWVPLGGTVEGITALNYDERLDQAVVKVNGVQKTLPLRKGGTTAHANGPAPVPPLQAGFNTPLPAAIPPVASMPPPTVAQPTMMAPPTAPAAAPTSTPGAPQDAQAKQETEARMLVSDLLEIGMAQRKAYEDAQRKANGGGAATPAPAQPAGATPGAPPPK